MTPELPGTTFDGKKCRWSSPAWFLTVKNGVGDASRDF
jgi:hypothetical protein